MVWLAFARLLKGNSTPLKSTENSGLYGMAPSVEIRFGASFLCAESSIIDGQFPGGDSLLGWRFCGVARRGVFGEKPAFQKR